MDARFLSASSFRPMRLSTSLSNVKIVMRCRDTVVGLRMRDVDTQVRELIEVGMVERAVKMGEEMVNFEGGGFDIVKLHSLYRTIGLTHLRDSLFDDSFSMFQKGHMDPLVLISLFPSVSSPLEVKDRLVATVVAHADGGRKAKKLFDEVGKVGGSVEEIVKAGLERNYPNADEETMTSFGAALVANAKEMLLKYLNYAATQKEWTAYLKEIRTAQVKLLCDSGNFDTLKTIIIPDAPLHFEECEEFVLRME
ncbi:hypothetical protein HDU67_003377, partial [Dinochytrium kinnereticum]